MTALERIHHHALDVERHPLPFTLKVATHGVYLAPIRRLGFTARVRDLERGACATAQRDGLAFIRYGDNALEAARRLWMALLYPLTEEQPAGWRGVRPAALNALGPVDPA